MVVHTQCFSSSSAPGRSPDEDEIDLLARRGRSGCLGDRIVKLFTSDTADGSFGPTGNSDTSEQQGDVGVWSLGNTGLRDGFFYVKAKKTPDCKSGKSKVLELVDGVPQ